MSTPKLDKLSQTVLDKIQQINPSKIIFITPNLTNPTIKRIIDNNTSGVIEIYDPTGKMLATYSEQFAEKYNTMINDLYSYSDVETDEDMKELRETIGEEGMKTEIDEFFDSHEEHKEFINEYCGSESIKRKYIISLFSKVLKGTVLLSNKIKQKSIAEANKIVFRSELEFVKNGRNLIILFNSSSIPKEKKLINILKEKEENIILIEHKPEIETNYWKIYDLFQYNFNPIYSTKNKYCYTNF